MTWRNGIDPEMLADILLGIAGELEWHETLIARLTLRGIKEENMEAKAKQPEFERRAVMVKRPVSLITIDGAGLWELDRFDRGDRIDQLVWDSNTDTIFIGYGFEGFGAVDDEDDVWAYQSVDVYDSRRESKRDAMRRWCKHVEEVTR